MKANAVSALVFGAFLCTASAVVAQTSVGAPAVDFEGTGAAQAGALGDCGAGCPVVASRGGRPTGYVDSASAAGLLAHRRPSSSEQQRQSPPSSSEVENLFWQSIATSTNPADFEAYLEQFPNGTYAPLARNRLAALRGAGDAPRRTAPDAPRRAAPAVVSPPRRAAPDASPPPRRRPGPPAVFALGFYRNELRDFASRCPKARFARSLGLASLVVMRSRESMTSGWMELLDARGNLVTATTARLERNRIDDICERIPSSGLQTVQEAARAARRSSSVENSAVRVFVRNSRFNPTPLTRGELQRFAQRCPRIRLAPVIGLARYVVTNVHGNSLVMHNTRGDWWRLFSVRRRQNLFNDACEYLSSR